MFERTVRVSYITSKNCFCYLPEENSKYLQQGNILQLELNGRSVFLSVGGFLPSLKAGQLGLNPLFATVLNISKKEEVFIRLSQNVPSIQRVIISPLNTGDYDILEIIASQVEETLLRQIRVVHKGQRFIIWISNFSTICVHVDGVEPVSPGCLDFLTEIVVNQPAAAHTKNKNAVNNTNKENFGIENIFNSYADDSTKLNNLVFNLVPIENGNSSLDSNTAHISYEFVSSKCLVLDDLDIICQLNIIKFPPFVDTDKLIFVRIRKLERHQQTNYFDNCLFIHKTILDFAKIPVGSKVTLDIVKEESSVETIKIFTNSVNLPAAVKEFKERLTANKIVFNPEVPFYINKNTVCSLKFDAKFVAIDSEIISKCKLIPEFSNKLVVSENKVEPLVTSFCDIGNMEEDVVGTLKMVFESRRSWENILVVGKRGMGKTTLTKIIQEKLQRQFYVTTERVNCRSVKGKSLDSLHKLLSPVITKLIYFQPSLLILEDIDVICGMVAESDVPTQEGLYQNKVAEMLARILEWELKHNKVMVLGTTTSLDLNQKIYASRGKHLFKNIYNVPDLTKDDRKILIEYLFAAKSTGIQNVDVEAFAIKSEGFVIRDIVDFANKAIFEAVKTGNTIVSNEHCEVALQNVSDICLDNVNLHSPGNRDFSDIGGLEEAKEILLANLVWPLQFPNLFDKAPLRLQSGLLLYGLPGTGKTILAAAAAKQCGLRLISVKGPELLSKYIGASEQGVRDVFEKAQRAKPCILFFDEFDSLAPRRGHDSTGVTDRVVNQLLTQLDGVESLSGVCVLAATSRPDLLDPALLRPGRLDRQILCPLPDEKARFEILEALSKSLKLSEDVDLRALSAATEGFTGADLQSIVYTAQLSSLEFLLGDSQEANTDAVISKRNFDEALRSTGPSVTDRERQKYERIYFKFQHGNIADLKNMQQKATLA